MNQMEQSKNRTIRLIAADNKIFDVEEQYVKCSETIKTMMELCCKEDDGIVTVPVPLIRSEILRKILHWATYHHENVEAAKVLNRDGICLWDANFLMEDKSTLFAIMAAANYLNIKDLLDSTSKVIANMIKAKRPDEVRDTLGLENDFTPAEEEQMRQDNDWHEI